MEWVRRQRRRRGGQVAAAAQANVTGIDFYGVTRSQTPQRRRKEGGNGGGGFGLRAPWTVRCGGVAL